MLKFVETSSGFVFYVAAMMFTLLGSLAHAGGGATTNAAPAQTQPKATPYEALAREFLRALLTKDERALQAYGPDFFIDGKLETITSDFLYNPDPKHKKRSVLQIASEGDLQIIVVLHQRKNVATVIYVPSKYAVKARKLAFLQKEWMNKYFACEFELTKPKWTLYYNFCFSETDGPYSDE